MDRGGEAKGVARKKAKGARWVVGLGGWGRDEFVPDESRLASVPLSADVLWLSQ